MSPAPTQAQRLSFYRGTITPAFDASKCWSVRPLSAPAGTECCDLILFTIKASASAPGGKEAVTVHSGAGEALMSRAVLALLYFTSSVGHGISEHVFSPHSTRPAPHGKGFSRSWRRAGSAGTPGRAVPADGEQLRAALGRSAEGSQRGRGPERSLSYTGPPKIRPHG